MSRDSARNVSTKVPLRETADLLKAIPSLGLRPRTALQVAAQLAQERRRPWMKVRRRTFQSILSFDVFMHELERTKPTFGTFFTNHVASAMHRYWAAKYPADYASFEYDAEWVRTYKREIDWALDQADDMLGRLSTFAAANDYELWIATSMGQAATEAKSAKTQVYLQDLARFMSALGFAASDWETRPAMLPRVIIAARTADVANALASKLERIQVADRGPLPWRRLSENVFRIHPGVLQDVRDLTCVVEGKRVPFSEAGFENVIVQDSVGQSAYHVPAGALIVHRPGEQARTAGRTQISTLDVAPAILNTLDLRIPDYMRAPAAL
jgi:hypothetical protein